MRVGEIPMIEAWIIVPFENEVCKKDVKDYHALAESTMMRAI